MEPIKYIDRASGQECAERVYGGKILAFLYGDSFMSRWVGRPLVYFLARLPILSAAYGWWQRQPWTRRKIAPFIQEYHIDATEFLDPVGSYRSFNDFFVRKLKESARPITPGDTTAIIPADARYRFIPNMAEADGFIVKGEKFSLAELLGDRALAEKYAQGSLVMARLCPVDYHRFHFPCDGIPGSPHLINGSLFSVNPIALKKNIRIYTQNKRMVTTVASKAFGEVLYVEVGATNVGVIHHTYAPNRPCGKGGEKGFFSFGGSALLVLFLPNTIVFDEDLLRAPPGMEIFCRMGQPMGQPPGGG